MRKENRHAYIWLKISKVYIFRVNSVNFVIYKDVLHVLRENICKANECLPCFLRNIRHYKNSRWNSTRLNFCCILIISVFARRTRIFPKTPSRSSKRERVRGVDRAIHSTELDSRVDAFFARPSRNRFNFEQIEKAADPIISASRFLLDGDRNDRGWRIWINVRYISLTKIYV